MVLAEGQQCLARWTEYFKSLLCQSSNTEEEAEPIIQWNEQPVADPTIEEVRASVNKLKNNKAPGSDNIPGELFKYGGEALCRKLHELIGKIWECEEMPEEWELGILCPVYKKGDKLECSNYRGINLLNTATIRILAQLRLLIVSVFHVVDFLVQFSCVSRFC